MKIWQMMTSILLCHAFFLCFNFLYSGPRDRSRVQTLPEQNVFGIAMLLGSEIRSSYSNLGGPCPARGKRQVCSDVPGFGFTPYVSHNMFTTLKWPSRAAERSQRQTGQTNKKKWNKVIRLQESVGINWCHQSHKSVI